MLNLFKLPFRFNSKDGENAIPHNDLSLGIFRNFVRTKKPAKADVNWAFDTISDELECLDEELIESKLEMYQKMTQLLRQIDCKLEEPN